MNDFPFKNLNDAKEEYSKLSEQVVSLTSKAAEFDALSATNLELTSQLASFVSEKAALEAKVESLNLESVAALAAKDKEITAFAAEKVDLLAQISVFKKDKKTVTATARELVAASAASGPASVDASEVELQGKDLMAAMQAEKDPDKLYALYEAFKRQSGTK